MKLRLAAATILFFFTPLALSPVYAAVVINEIFPKPTDPANQWIELYNTGTDSVSMNLWKLENSAGNNFIIPADGIIPSKGFYTVSKSRTGIDLKADGDTVKLIDLNGTLVDSQSYQSTLGTNNSVGRSPDGGPGMTVCTTNTKNLPNDCPTPTITPSPTPSPAPAATDAPVNTPLPQSGDIPPFVAASTPGKVLGASSIIPSDTPTPTPDENVIQIPVPKTVVVSKTLVWQIIAVALSWMILAILAKMNGRRNRRKKKSVSPPPDSGPLPH
jgi:hypothetical protein